MSKLSNLLKMYTLLQARKRIKIRELAQLLEVNERMVRVYRDWLEEAGIMINSEKGIYGGYSLYNDNHLLGLNLTESEYRSLQLFEKECKDSKHIASGDITSLLNKFNAVRSKKCEEVVTVETHMKRVAYGSIDSELEKRIVLDIHVAVITRKKVRIKYSSLNSGISERIVRPYATFQYKDDMYFIGYCELRKEIRDFKICRISDYEVLDEPFEMDKSFKIEDAMKNCIGIYKDKEYDVKLKICHPMSQIIKEKIWVENQEIIDDGAGQIVFSARMRGLQEIKSWILWMGSCAQVLSPEEIINDIKKEVEKMKELYY